MLIEHFAFQSIRFTNNNLLAIAYAGLLSTVAGFIFYGKALTLLGSYKCSFFLALMPIFGAALSYIFLNETVANWDVGLFIGLVTLTIWAQQ
jgi:drug/metabolite transporter (DMT)-like permease